MGQRLFVYGTLQLPEITERVVGRALSGTPASLPGFRSGLVARANFPGIVVDENASVQGLLVGGLTWQDLHQLDRYEGELYRRLKVNVLQVDAEGTAYNTTEKNEPMCQCWVYAIAGWAEQRVTHIPWTLEWYRQQGMKGRLTYRS